VPIDDCVWIVFPDGFVARGIPMGNPINPPTPTDQLRRRPEALDIVYTPNSHFGALFAERHTAEYYGKIARAISDSTTWGEFRNALPPDVWDDVLNDRGDDEPDDDEPFPQQEFQWGYNDGRFIGGWPTEDELSWFPEDLIEKYGGSVDLTGPNYDQLYFPPESPTTSPRSCAHAATRWRRPRPAIYRTGSTLSGPTDRLGPTMASGTSAAPQPVCSLPL
jgi:hypothetical protein